jgi:hypothetical protein
MRFIILALILFAAGCSTMVDPTKMTPEQMKEWAKDDKGFVMCVRAATPGGNVTSIYANLDEKNRMAGTVVVDPDCKTTVQTAPQAATKPASAASAP